MIDNALRILKGYPVLKKIIETIPEPNIESTNDVFFDLMSCVLEQQIHYNSTKRVFQTIGASISRWPSSIYWLGKNIIKGSKKRVNNNLLLSGRLLFAQTTIFLCE